MMISAVGARSGLGLSARQIALGLRAGCRPSVTTSAADATWRIAPTPELPPEVPFEARLSAMLRGAMAEAYSFAPQPDLPLLLALPSNTAAIPFDGGRVLTALSHDAPIDLARSSILLGGYEAFAAALKKASELLEVETALQGVWVGAADSWLDPLRLRQLLAEHRIAPTTRRADPRRGQLLPGEAGVVLRLGRVANDPAGLALIREVHLGSSSAEYNAESALALIRSKAQSKRWLITEQNGEAVRSRAWTQALRKQQREGTEYELEEEPPFVQHGDVGAASGALAVALVCVAFEGDFAPAAEAAIVLADERTSSSCLLERLASQPPANLPHAIRFAGLNVTAALRAFLWRKTWGFEEQAHRLPSSARTAVREPLHRIHDGLSQLERAEPEDASLVVLDATREAVQALSTALETIHEQQRTAAVPEPLLDLERAMPEVSGVLAELRETLLQQLATLGLRSPPQTSTAKLVLGEAMPKPLLLPYRAPAEPALQVSSPSSESPSTGRPERVADGPQNSRIGQVLDELGRVYNARIPPPQTPTSLSALARTDRKLTRDLEWLVSLDQPFARLSLPEPLENTRLDVVQAVRRVESVQSTGRNFAKTLILACARDAGYNREACERLWSVEQAAVAPAIAALSLGVGPELGRSLERLCLEPDAQVLCNTLEVLRRRRSGGVAYMAPLLYHPAPHVRVAAARALAAGSLNSIARDALRGRLGAERQTEVRAALLEALVRLRDPNAGNLVQAELADGPLHRAKLLELQSALGVELAVKEPGEHGLELLGWSGRVLAIEPLLQILSSSPTSSVALACARSLTRITGASCAPRSKTLAEAPQDSVREEALCTEPDEWRRYWAKHGVAFGTSSKYRFGRPFTVALAVREWLSEGTRALDRELCRLEVEACSELRLVDESDWACRQQACEKLIAD